MSIKWRDSAAVSRSAGSAYFRTADGVSAGDRKTVDKIRLRLVDGADPEDLSEVYRQGIRLVATPDYAAGSSTTKTGPIYTNTVTVGVADGTPPYTHSWSATAGISVAAPTSSSTPFIGVPPAFSGEITGTATDTVTDANGVTNSVTIDVTISRDF